MKTAEFPHTAQPMTLRGMSRLVRGNEQRLIERIQPLVQRQDVTLDLEETRHIDAAGLAALVTLYCDACQAGRRFAVANPSPQVRQILALVGLDRILLSRMTNEISRYGTQCEMPAA
jgi:anti-anti-sigma factor